MLIVFVSSSLSLSLFAPVADLLFVEEIPKRVVDVFVRAHFARKFDIHRNNTYMCRKWLIKISYCVCVCVVQEHHFELIKDGYVGSLSSADFPTFTELKQHLLTQHML